MKTYEIIHNIIDKENRKREEAINDYKDGDLTENEYREYLNTIEMTIYALSEVLNNLSVTQRDAE